MRTTDRFAFRSSVTALALALGAALTGCPSYRISAPRGFAVAPQGQSHYDYRAVSAYGVALGVRVLANPARGDLAFWAEAVDREVRRSGGYRPSQTVAVRSADGIRGLRMEYTRGQGPAAATYWVTLFVTGGRIY